MMAAIAGGVGAVAGVILWMYHWKPQSSFMGSYAFEMVHGGPMRDNLIGLALGCGVAAIAAALLGTFGSRRVRATLPVGLILGAIALSYPVCALLHLVHTH
jgi:hypothetical protein